MLRLPPVTSKRDFVRRYEAGEFGNRAPTWNTLEEYLASGYNGGRVHIRNRVAGAPTWYDIEPDAVVDKTAEIIRNEWATSDQLYFSGMAPTHLTTFQGEVQRSTNHLDLYWSTVKQPMRQSLLEGGRQSYNLSASLLLKRFFDPSSYDWLQYLLDGYPDHVIEFSCYGVYWGTVPRRNTVIWEVRAY